METLLDLGKILLGASIGFLGTTWYDRVKRSRRGEDLRRLFRARASAFYDDAYSHYCHGFQFSKERFEFHIEHLLSLMSDTDLLTLAAEDGWIRTLLVHSQRELVFSQKLLQEGGQDRSRFVETILKNPAICVLRTYKKWRKPPPGTRYTTGIPMTELRWHQLRRWGPRKVGSIISLDFDY